MEKVKNLRWGLILILVLVLLFPAVLSFGAYELTPEEKREVEGRLLDSYRGLPGIEFEFEQAGASYEEVSVKPYSGLALSVPNLEGGQVLGVVTYGETVYLMMALKLPENMGTDYGAGLIDLAQEEVAFVSGAELSTQKNNVDEIGFELAPIEGTENLELVVNDQKYVLKTLVPMSL